MLKHGILEEDIGKLFEQVVFEQLDKDALQRQVDNYLNEMFTGIDPQNSLNLLSYWIFRASEKRESINIATINNQIKNIGQYLAECATHQKEWFTSILPIEDIPIQSSEEYLRQQFHKGIAARYEHILANADVLRPQKCQAIHEAFQKSNIVVIHGASGQGKSTLAYRYVHEFFPEKWRFVVRLIENRQHCKSIARALMGHVNTINLPALIYLDISPRETYWLDLIKEIAPYKNLHILVTIRQEDWQRAHLSGAEIQFETIELILNKVEAAELYPSLRAYTNSSQFLSFDDAWQHFSVGTETPLLLEYTYFVTQQEVLRIRLSEQVTRLQDEVRCKTLAAEELQLLQLVAVASAYHARIDLRKLVKYLALSVPERTLELFEKEFLLRYSQDQRFVEGIHPVRSLILVDLLTDDNFKPWEEAANIVLALISETDIEIFLLHAFSKRIETSPKLLKALLTLHPTTWTGVGNITCALLWLGIKQYVSDNRIVINESFAKLKSGWWMFFDADLADVLENASQSRENLVNILLKSDRQDEARAFVQNIQSRQTPKRDAFRYVIEWLSRLEKQPISPKNNIDWLGLANFYFWVGYLQINSSCLDWKVEKEFEKELTELSLESLAEVIMALSFARADAFNAWLNGHREQLLQRFQKETQSIFVEDDGETIRAHFIVDIEKPHEDSKEQNRLHDITLHKVYLLRKLFPNRKFYGCQGYGHQFLQLPHDDTQKTQIPVSSLAPSQAIQVNSIFRRLSVYELRPTDWNSYVGEVFSLRTAILERLEEIQNALLAHFKAKEVINLIREHVNSTEYDKLRENKNALLLPKAAVDEWGFTEELMADSQDKTNVSSFFQEVTCALALQKYKTYQSSIGKFLGGLGNFLGQALEVIMLNPSLGRARTNEQKRQLHNLAEKQGLNPRFTHLSVVNLAEMIKILPTLQQEFRQHFADFINSEELTHLEQREQDVFLATWSLWFKFAVHPEIFAKININKEKLRLENSLEISRKEIRKQFRKLSDGVTAKILSESVLWEEQRALWISYDVENPLMFYTGLQEMMTGLMAAFNKILGKDIFHSLDYYSYEFFWSNIVIVPLIQGKSLEQTAYKFTTLVFLTKCNQSINDMGHWNYISYPLTELQKQAINIPVWEIAQLEIGTNFRQAIKKLQLSIAHLNDFNELPTEWCSEVLRDYIRDKSASLSTTCQNALDKVGDILNRLNTLSPDEQLQPYLLKIAQLLVEHSPSILPPQWDQQCSQLDINIIDFMEWKQNLTSISGEMELCYFCWIARVMELDRMS